MSVRRNTSLAIVVASALGLIAAPRAQQSSGVKAFTGITVIDGTNRPAVSNATILVREGRITSIGPSATVPIPAGAERILLAGKTVVPGMINTHAHLGGPTTERGLQTYAQYGVTTVMLQGADGPDVFGARDRQSDWASLNRARLYTAGPVLAPTSVENARELVAKNQQMNVDFIKIRVDDAAGGLMGAGALATMPRMTPAIYRAVIDEAHKRGLRVSVHIFYQKDAEGVLEAGADFLTHDVRDQDVNAKVIGLLKARGVCVCSALVRETASFVYGTTPDFFSDAFFLKYADMTQVERLKDPARQEAMRTSEAAKHFQTALYVSMRNIKKLEDSGATVAMGTDSGGGDRFPGFFEQQELLLMAKAGLTTRQILAAATSDAARCMKIDKDLGTLEVGKWADFIALDGSPLADIANMRKINAVYIAGNKVAR